MVTHSECQVVDLLRPLLEKPYIISSILVVEKLDVFEVLSPNFMLWLGVNPLLIKAIPSHLKDYLLAVKRVC